MSNRPVRWVKARWCNVLFINLSTGMDQTVFIDFEKFAEVQLSNLDEFLIEFCYMISDALNVPEAIDKYWSSPTTLRTDEM